MKLTSTLLLLLALTATLPAAADFEAAAATYRSGDYNAAFSQFMPLAESGDPRAQTIVAMMYKYGEAVQQSWPAAFDWYSKAAEAGYVPAQFALGEMYADGQGVTRDRDQAVRWLTLAAEGGLGKANDKLRELEAIQVDVEEESEEIIAWSQAWKLHLPTEMKLAPPGPAQVAEASTPGESLYRVQLGAMRSLDTARELWESLRARADDLFEGMQPLYRRKDVSSGVVYTLQTGPFPSMLAAKRFCEEVANRGIESGCLPLRSASRSE